MDVSLLSINGSEQLLKTPDYKVLCELLSGENNSKRGISDVEVQHLCWLGANIPVGGDIVEIGSHRGKSTCSLGSGLVYSGNTSARLFAIDLWTLGTTTFDHYKSQETFEIFHRQIAEIGLSDVVKPIMSSSEKAVIKRRRPIHLLFIDASHKYKDVLLDFMNWSKFIPVGGRVAFHDYGGRFKDVTKVVDEEVISTNNWDDYHVYGRIFSATRKRL